MEEKIKVSTPRKRRSFGMADVRRLHRQSGERVSLKKWARANKNMLKQQTRTPSSKIKGLLA